ncbi:MAG: Rid family hydrolase [Panacagrimonas sp.]
MLRILLVLTALCLSACAGPTKAPPKPLQPEFIVPPGAEFVSGMFGYSQAARVGPWLMVSAQVGFDTEKRGFPADFEQQVHAAFRNLQTVLEAAGAELDDVVELTSYQLDMKRFNDVVDIKTEYFGEHRPAWSAIGVEALPLPQLQFQIKATAWAPNADIGAADTDASVVPPSADGGPSAQSKKPFRFRPGY